MKNPAISWSAIFAGAIAGVGANFLFNLLALSLGIDSFSIDSPGETRFSYSGIAGFILFAVLAMFFTGFIAGILTPKFKNKIWGLLYGFLSWCVLLIFTIILITNFIQYTAFHTNFSSNLVAVKIQNNSPMLTETKAHALKNTPLSFNIETHKKIITLNAYFTFFLFFVGALSSMFGGLTGYSFSRINISKDEPN